MHGGKNFSSGNDVRTLASVFDRSKEEVRAILSRDIIENMAKGLKVL